MKYYISEPPIHIRSFKELKKAEAQVYYDWYIGECKNRILLLKERVNEDIDCSFDYSVISLLLFGWHAFHFYFYQICTLVMLMLLTLSNELAIKWKIFTNIHSK